MRHSTLLLLLALSICAAAWKDKDSAKQRSKELKDLLDTKVRL